VLFVANPPFGFLVSAPEASPVLSS
jgi:hypothetical protein